MKATRIAVIGLGQRSASVLWAIQEVGWDFELAGYADPQPVGLPILNEADIAPGRAYASAETLLEDGPFDLVMIGSPNHLHLHLLAAFSQRCRSGDGAPSAGGAGRRRTSPGHAAGVDGSGLTVMAIKRAMQSRSSTVGRCGPTMTNAAPAAI